MLALCVTAASAATLSNNLVASKVTQLVTTTATPAYAACPAGYDCMTEADAASQLGTYEKSPGAPVCGYKQSTTAVALIQVPQYCVKKSGTPVQATCPGDCSCMLESAAKDKFQGVYQQCGDTPCATIVTGAAKLSAYCFGPGTTTTTPACPTGCVCITDALAKQRYGDYSRCNPDGSPCGYEQDQTPKYCIKQGSTTPACPEGYSCITNATVAAQGGTWTRYSPDACGYEQSTATLAAVVQVPKYCWKQQETTPVCPDGCTCISDADAKLKGLTTRCDPNANPCGYQSSTVTANIQANRIPLYCYKTDTTITSQPICPDNCGGCMNEADAKAKYGPFNYTRCSEKVCGYDQTATSAYAQPKYCFRPTVTVTPTLQVCKEGCYCVQEAEAKAKFGSGNYARCDPNGQPCGYDQSAASANGIPRYCFRPTGTVTPAPAVCPQGCACTTDEIAKIKGLTPCRGSRTSCGYDENKQPLYCFEQVPSPTCVYDYQKNACSGTCQQGYTCGLLASEKDATGKITYAVCGCTGQPATSCAYDAQKNVCTGTCQTGGACTVVGRNVDEKSGAATPVCGCPQQSSCSYNYDKEACAGSCTLTGENCQLNTIYRDPTTGKVTYAECHCKGSGTETCAFNAQNYCVGTCQQGGQCANTSVVDASGKMTFVCTCAGGSNCVLSVNNECSGTCVTGAPCARIVTKDDSGQEKVSCGCGGTPAGTAAGVATRQPGLFDGIAGFFNRLFGGK